MEDGLQLGFKTMEEELSNIELPVIGIIPAWLSGTYIRNGFSKWEVGKEKYRHWFDGLAMLHGFTFQGGKVIYTNKFLQSEAYKQAIKSQKIAFSEFATEPTSSYLGRVFLRIAQKFTDNAAVNIEKIAGCYVAMTETPLRVEFDPKTLKTLGRFKYDDDITAQLTTAHPHIDYKTKEVINFYTRFSLKNYHDIYRIKEGTKKRELICSIKVDEPAYMHTFSITENYIILVEFPLFLNPLNLLFSGKPLIDNLTWKPDKGVRFFVVNRANGKLVKTLHSSTCFCYHHINAFEKDGGIFIDMVVYEDARLVETGYLARLRNGELTMPIPEIRRYHLPLDKNSKVGFEVLSEDFVEFPRIHYKKHNMHDYSIIYGMSSNLSYGFLNHLKKIDIKRNKTQMWFEEGCYPGEPVFVTKHDDAAEDEGVVLAVVLNTKTKTSFLLILDAYSFEEIARAEIPHCIPFGAHGQYYKEEVQQ